MNEWLSLQDTKHLGHKSKPIKWVSFIYNLCCSPSRHSNWCGHLIRKTETPCCRQHPSKNSYFGNLSDEINLFILQMKAATASCGLASVPPSSIHLNLCSDFQELSFDHYKISNLWFARLNPILQLPCLFKVISSLLNGSMLNGLRLHETTFSVFVYLHAESR